MLALASGLLAGAADARTYYISPSGNDANSGTSTKTPFRTYWTASHHLQPGDTLAFMPGTYPSFGIGVSGHDGKTVNFTAQNPADPPNIVSTDQYAAIFVEADYVSISYMNVTTGRSSDAAGLQIYGSSHVVVSNMTAHDSGGGGLMAVYSDYVQLLNSAVFDNSFSAPNQTSGIGIGFGVNSDTKPGTHNVIAGNISYHNRNEVVLPGTNYTTDGNGIIIDTMTKTNYVGNTVVYNNISYANGGSGVRVIKSNNICITNNTAVGNFQDPKIAGVRGEISVVYANNIGVHNNIANATAGNVYTFVDAGTSGDYYDYNLSFGGVSGGRYIGSSNAVFGLHNQFGKNPQFVSSGSYQLESSSPALRRANGYVAPWDDILGHRRPADHLNVDLGAYQQSH